MRLRLYRAQPSRSDLKTAGGWMELDLVSSGSPFRFWKGLTGRMQAPIRLIDACILRKTHCQNESRAPNWTLRGLLPWALVIKPNALLFCVVTGPSRRARFNKFD